MDTKTNDIAQVAQRLVELCRTGQYDQAQQELYAEDAISIEGDGQKPDAVTRGKKNVNLE
ncbi:SnoaL-like domain-containing protein [Lysobacter sp.]|uniref:SnoaL-like domain-containing protein n=1 Tax=Lysobacter sp. TaxID=72226 RepID=UPI002D693ACF|nr:SnoaL-like domain-containing protein [Lysobacter sp.]HZX75545.1 SnoaL-like domain-containing protein [Lysobacter sp.]